VVLGFGEFACEVEWFASDSVALGCGPGAAWFGWAPVGLTAPPFPVGVIHGGLALTADGFAAPDVQVPPGISGLAVAP